MNSARCRVCNSKNLSLAWKLESSPYGDLYRHTREEAISLPKMGLTLVICVECELLQLAETVDAVEIYSGYLYQSSVTFGLGSYYRRLSRSLISRLNLSERDLVVDVGSNDGTFLEYFGEAKVRVLGIEPSTIPSETSRAKGIQTISSFLTDGIVSEVLAKHGKASLVCANYVAANVPNPVEFFQNIRMLLTDDGEFSVITGYHPDQFAVNMFDYINHDHLSYFSVTSAMRLAESSGFILVSADRVEHKGGSVHLTFRPVECGFGPDESVGKLLQREKWLGSGEPGTYRALSERMSVIGLETERLLGLERDRAVTGIGASISSTHLLHQFRLGSEVTELLDDDVNKVGRFSPGFGIEVKPLGSIVDLNVRHCVLLAWQHTDQILKRIKNIGFVGSVTVPLPHPRRITIGN